MSPSREKPLAAELREFARMLGIQVPDSAPMRNVWAAVLISRQWAELRDFMDRVRHWNMGRLSIFDSYDRQRAAAYPFEPNALTAFLDRAARNCDACGHPELWHMVEEEADWRLYKKHCGSPECKCEGFTPMKRAWHLRALQQRARGVCPNCSQDLPIADWLRELDP